MRAGTFTLPTITICSILLNRPTVSICMCGAYLVGRLHFNYDFDMPSIKKISLKGFLHILIPRKVSPTWKIQQEKW